MTPSLKARNAMLLIMLMNLPIQFEPIISMVWRGYFLNDLCKYHTESRGNSFKLRLVYVRPTYPLAFLAFHLIHSNKVFYASAFLILPLQVNPSLYLKCSNDRSKRIWTIMTIEFKLDFSRNGNSFLSSFVFIVCELFQNLFEVLAGFPNGIPGEF